MPWARGGDTSATYPPAMRTAALRGADQRTVNEVFGFFFRLSTQSAAHMTDYVVDAGTVQMLGGANSATLIRFCCKVGLLTKVRVEGMTAYKLIDDPEFIHIRLASEVEWERQQRADTSDLRLTIPVRARDGDLCRYCAVPVQWRGRTSTRKATLDHLEPGKPATVDTMVVACKGCNSELRDTAGIARESLCPAPDVPFYSPFTAEWLTNNGRPTAPTQAPPQRPATQADHATAGGPPHGRAPAQRPATQADHAPTIDTPNQVATQQPAGSRGDAADSDPATAGHRAAAHQNARAPDIPPAFPVTAGMSSAGSGRDGSGTARRSASTYPPVSTRQRRSPRGRPRDSR